MKRHHYLTAPAMALTLSAAWAAPGDSGPTLDWSGYGTAAYTMADTGQAEFARFNQASGVQRTPRAGVDSNLGIQGTLAVNDWLSFTGQGLARRNAVDRWGGEVYWAYAKANLSREWSVYAGRVAAPVYMISDYRQVGFASTMIRPPQELYSQVVFDNIDGASLSYRTMAGDANLTLQLAAGNATAKLALQGAAPGSHQSIRAHAFKALNLQGEQGPLTLRLGYAHTSVSLEGDPQLAALTGALTEAGAGYGMPQLSRLAAALAVRGKSASFKSAGLVLDLEPLLVQAEFGQRKTASSIPDSTAWYVLGGYRVRQLMPYAAFASLKSRNSVSNAVPAACPDGMPDSCTPALQALSDAVSAGLAGSLVEQTTASVGVRWNFMQSAACKVQLDRVRPRRGGLLLNSAPGMHGAVTVFAAGVDFVF
ncbi:hypothetical protein GJ700_01670 [Duganella sp. FT92W]|uniref:Porin n=1 Tax=Pseudoduganella rivuli TaxID=2666085 RepID=A0A7X2IIG4_9BURK|nr:hypothetical protein [Pseudoduganella rivuli]MRV70430.1 hypothetical protein [Pseudoduganella rivuli]